ncbi:MAG: hypothetical protein RLY93_20420 [Sumerlaeia bacterium]
MRTIPSLLGLALMFCGLGEFVRGDSFNETDFLVGPFYDVEGRVGLQHRVTTLPSDMIFVFVQGEGPAFFDPFLSFVEELPVVAGTPLSFKAIVPQIAANGDCITGYLGAESYANGSHLEWFVPVKASEVSLNPFGEDESENVIPGVEDYLFIELVMSVTESRTQPSLQSGITWIPGLSERSVTVTAEYLNGNDLFQKVQDVHIYPSATTDGPFAEYYLRWGPFPDPTPRPSFVHFDADAPVGPMNLHFKLDGYTTETIHMDVQPLYSYKYYGLVTPNYDGTEPPGPGPTELSKFNFPDAPSLGLIRKSIADVVTCGCIPTSEIEPYIEQNDDTIRDAADIVRAMRQATPPPRR